MDFENKNKKVKKYFLFFDIECIQVANQDYIFSFGYVICNKDFQILKQEDLLINPNINFQTSTGIRIHYNWNKVLSQPSFEAMYVEIKSLLENEDYQIVGHAIDNDIKFLLHECQEYNLPGFEFDFIDSQILFDYLHKNTHRSSISTILEYYQLKAEVLHRSDMDAYYNMLYCQKMANEFKKDLESLINNPILIRGFLSGLKFQRPLIKDWIYKPTRTENKLALLDRINLNQYPIRTEKLNGKTFAINTKLLYENLDIGLYLIKLILENSGKFQQSNPNPTIFIYSENDCVRQQKLQSNQKWEGMFWSVKEFCEEIGEIDLNIEDMSKGFYESCL